MQLVAAANMNAINEDLRKRCPAICLADHFLFQIRRKGCVVFGVADALAVEQPFGCGAKSAKLSCVEDYVCHTGLRLSPGLLDLSSI